MRTTKDELLKFDTTNAPTSIFTDTVLSVLDKYSSKNEINTFNMNIQTIVSLWQKKKMGKATISRSNLRQKFFKTGTEESKKGFNRQKNFCVSLVCKTIEKFGKLWLLFFRGELFARNLSFLIITTKYQ